MTDPTLARFVDGLLQSQLLSPAQGEEVVRLKDSGLNARELAQEVLRRAWLTPFQVNQICQGHAGELTIGPFILLERLGEGGMGQVFKARQKVLDRVVALKVIRKECLANPKAILRFQREIRAAGQLNHANIVRAYDADEVNGTWYIAMEYIDGADLSKLIKKQGPLPVEQACDYIRQAALGLQHASERGLVHRDLKPANLLVGTAIASDRRRSSGLIPRPASGVINRASMAQQYPWGIVKILDMGLARCDETAMYRASTHLTQLGTLMGTPEYIAPEQARDSHTSDVRADLYSLGCTLYFLLTGQPPFPDGTLTEKLLQHQIETPPPVEQVRREKLLAWKGERAKKEMLPVPPAVVAIVNKLLAKRPEDRHQTPIELANELQAIVKQLAEQAAPRGPVDLSVATTAEVLQVGSIDAIEPTVVERVSVVEWPRKPRVNWPLAIGSLVGAGAAVLMFLGLATTAAVVMARGGGLSAGDPPPAKAKNAEKSRTNVRR